MLRKFLVRFLFELMSSLRVDKIRLVPRENLKHLGRHDILVTCFKYLTKSTIFKSLLPIPVPEFKRCSKIN